MFTGNLFALGKTTVLGGSELEQRLTTLLFDDNLQVLSKYELNQLASLTYHEDTVQKTAAVTASVFTTTTPGQPTPPPTNFTRDLCDSILETLRGILSQPISHSPLTMHKALVVTEHCLIFGADRVPAKVNQILGRWIEPLPEGYNTAVLAAQQTGAAGMLYRLKGGGVDKGGPVRETAQRVLRLLSDPSHLQQQRQTLADPNSLVPVGDRHAVGFMSESVRQNALQKRIQDEQLHRMRLQSNLVKASDGFGGGYNSKDGKAVVGAAHGIEEMLKMANKDKQRFSDDGTNELPYQPPDFNNIEASVSIKYHENNKPNNNNNNQQQQMMMMRRKDQPYNNQQAIQSPGSGELDLLSMGMAPTATSSGTMYTPQAAADLLDLGGGSGSAETAAAAATVDFMGLHVGTNGHGAATSSSLLADPFALGSGANHPTSDDASDMLGMLSLNTPQQQQYTNDTTTAAAETSSTIQKKPIMSSSPSTFMSAQSDPFSGLDGLNSMQPKQQPQKAGGLGGGFGNMSLLQQQQQHQPTLSLQSSGGGPMSDLNPLQSYHHHQGMMANNGLSSSTTTMPLHPNSGSASYLNTLSTGSGMASPQYGGMGGNNGSGGLGGNISVSNMMMGGGPTTSSSLAMGTGAAAFGEEDDTDGFGGAMGGTVGAGLLPLGPAPSAPPPPPPPPPTGAF